MTEACSDALRAMISAEAMRAEPELIALRRDIHAHPELGFETERTSKLVSHELSKLGLRPRSGFGGTGVVADICGSTDGPCLIIRADMDALPIQEETGLSYASKYPGRMHACGHDIHTATLVGVAQVLTRLAPGLQGSVRVLFQPAEETNESGAWAMIRDGAADGADLAIGFHNWPEMAVGDFAYTRGIAMASGDEFDVVVEGVGGHAAEPHKTRDPIIAAAAMVMQLQTAVSRTVNPRHAAVLTIARIQGGTTYNLVPDQCLLQGTMRCFEPETRRIMRETLYRVVEGVAASMGVAARINFMPGVPPLVNDPLVLDTVLTALQDQFGTDRFTEVAPTLAGEDFAYFSERLPSCHLLIGASQLGRNDRVHMATYQPDERSIALGVTALSRAAIDLLASSARRRNLPA